MKNKGEIRWLQLSDLHMFNTTEVKRQKKALYKQFRQHIDFIVITGDLHQYGEDYSLTLHFLNELVREMNITKQDIIIVPGNHDISTSSDSSERAKILEGIEKEIESNPDAYLTALDKLYSAFENYQKFLDEFYGCKTDFDPLSNRIHIWNDKLALLCLNTALVSDQKHDKMQIIDINGLDDLANNHYPCFAIMHHNYYSITPSQRSYLNAKFREAGVSAVLCGHEHKYSNDKIDLQNGESIRSYCCGKSLSEPNDLWSEIGIIEYRWKTKGEETKVLPYIWDSFHLSFKLSMKFENQSYPKGQTIIMGHGFPWRNHFRKILPSAAPKTSLKVLPIVKFLPPSRKVKTASGTFETPLWQLAVSTIISLVLAAIAWNADHPADSAGHAFRLSYTETLDDTLIALESKELMHEAWLQTIGQVIVTIKDKPIETFIIHGMYRQTTSITDSNKIVLKEYDCPLADSCVEKLKEELESQSVLYGYAKEDINVKKVAFMYVSANTGDSGEWISHYYIFDNSTLIYLDSDAAKAKMHGITLTTENWNNAKTREQILADTKEHVLTKLREIQSDY